MKFRLTRAAQGAQWVRQGFSIFIKQPIGFAMLFTMLLLALLVSMLVPVLGSLLLLAALPLVSLGFMIGTRRALEQRMPTPTVFVEPLKRGRPRVVALVQLGLLYALATALVMWLSAVVDGGALDRVMKAVADTKTTPEQLREQFFDGRLQMGLLLRFGLTGLLAVPFWHAPALVHWGGQSAAKSLFFSLMACWRNRGAFVVYGLVWAAAVLLFVLVANVLFGLLGAPQLIAFIAAPASLLFSTAFYASLYFTFADCFDIDAADDPPAVTP
jgi:hypothetical protein